VDDDIPTCARHSGTPTRLSCSACETAICPDCAIESAVGYKCPDCGTHGEPPRRDTGTGGGILSGLGALRSGSSPTGSGDAGAASAGEGLPRATTLRAVGIGLAAAFAGGVVLGFVFAGRTFFLISSGLIGWAVARAVYWATEDRNSSVVQGVALGLAGVAVIVGMTTAPGTTGQPDGILLLALPAAMYGAWIVARQR
jgi:hypothetical protein